MINNSIKVLKYAAGPALGVALMAMTGGIAVAQTNYSSELNTNNDSSAWNWNTDSYNNFSGWLSGSNEIPPAVGSDVSGDDVTGDIALSNNGGNTSDATDISYRLDVWNGKE